MPASATPHADALVDQVKAELLTELREVVFDHIAAAHDAIDDIGAVGYKPQMAAAAAHDAVNSAIDAAIDAAAATAARRGIAAVAGFAINTRHR